MACMSVARPVPLQGSFSSQSCAAVARSASAAPVSLTRFPCSRRRLATSSVSSSFSSSPLPGNKTHYGSCRYACQAQASASSSGRIPVSVPALLGILVVARAAVEKLLSGIGQVFSSIGASIKPTERDARLLAEIRQGGGGRLMLNAVAVPCFAALSRSAGPGPLTVVAGGMARWLELYSAVMLIRVLLSWFPNIPWEKQPLLAIKDMCDPYLNLFRNILPPLFNALDLSPMLAFLVLGMLSSLLSSSA